MVMKWRLAGLSALCFYESFLFGLVHSFVPFYAIRAGARVLGLAIIANPRFEMSAIGFTLMYSIAQKAGWDIVFCFSTIVVLLVYFMLAALVTPPDLPPNSIPAHYVLTFWTLSGLFAFPQRLVQHYLAEKYASVRDRSHQEEDLHNVVLATGIGRVLGPLVGWMLACLPPWQIEFEGGIMLAAAPLGAGCMLCVALLVLHGSACKSFHRLHHISSRVLQRIAQLCCGRWRDGGQAADGQQHMSRSASAQGAASGDATQAAYDRKVLRAACHATPGYPTYLIVMVARECEVGKPMRPMDFALLSAFRALIDLVLVERAAKLGQAFQLFDNTWIQSSPVECVGTCLSGLLMHCLIVLPEMEFMPSAAVLFLPLCLSAYGACNIRLRVAMKYLAENRRTQARWIVPRTVSRFVGGCVPYFLYAIRPSLPFLLPVLLLGSFKALELVGPTRRAFGRVWRNGGAAGAIATLPTALESGPGGGLPERVEPLLESLHIDVEEAAHADDNEGDEDAPFEMAQGDGISSQTLNEVSEALPAAAMEHS